MKGQLASFTYPKYNKLVLDNAKARLPKHVQHMHNMCGSQFPAKTFIYGQPFGLSGCTTQ